MVALSPFILLGLSTLGASAPAKTPVKKTNSGSGQVTAAQITTIMPSSASCASAAYKDECISAADAAPFINQGFAKYNVIKPGTKAALLALMLYESNGFQYNKNHFPAPGRPGQGTKNMQSAAYNTKYATALHPDKAAAAQAQGPDAVLGLVSNNADSLASAAWFLATQCDANVRPGLASGTKEGWTNYLNCIGTADSSDRDQVWTAAKAALGVQ